MMLPGFPHAMPLEGAIGGLLIGAGFSIFVAVTTAAKSSKSELAKLGPLPSVPDDEDED